MEHGADAVLACFPQDVLDNGVELDSSTIAHVWKWWFDPSQQQVAAGALPVSSGNTSSQRPPVCSLSQGCRGQAEQDDIPGWLHELDVVTKKVKPFTSLWRGSAWLHRLVSVHS